MDDDGYEALPDSAPFLAQLAAGSIAGVSEHSIMYPFDCVKTRLQTGASETSRPRHQCRRGLNMLPKAISVKEASESLVAILVRMWRVEGPYAITRGLSAAVAGAGPAHALYYTTYERAKTYFSNKMRSNSSLATVVSQAAAGCCATVMHDAVMNPAEVIKQRMQLSPRSGPSDGCGRQSSGPSGGGRYGQPQANYQQLRLKHNFRCQPGSKQPLPNSYSGCVDCVFKTLRKEGFVAFYRSYPTQLSMNIPYQATHFIIYEATLQRLNPTKKYSPFSHSIAGAIGGACAAALTTPLDVCKTLLNTQFCVRLHPELVQEKRILTGFREAAMTIYHCFGIRGFFRGASARMVIQAPSTAISWTVYEFFKHTLVAVER